MNKKAISPLIVTVLLIGLTIAISVGILIWGVNIQKSNIRNQETDLEKLGLVSFSPSYADSTCPNVNPGENCYRLLIKNNEDFPISLVVITHTSLGKDINSDYIIEGFDRKIIEVKYPSNLGTSNIRSEVKAAKI